MHKPISKPLTAQFTTISCFSHKYIFGLCQCLLFRALLPSPLASNSCSFSWRGSRIATVLPVSRGKMLVLVNAGTGVPKLRVHEHVERKRSQSAISGLVLAIFTGAIR